MIDFTNGTIVKLSPSQPSGDVISMLVQGEEIYLSFKGSRDSVHFTSKAWSVETAGTFDRDCELEVWFSGLGKVRLEFAGSVDIKVIGQIIGDKVL